MLYAIPLNKTKEFDTLENTSILSAKIQTPISINRNTSNKFMTNVSFDNKCTYMFEICLDF